MEFVDINPALHDMIRRGQLSPRKTSELVRLKSLVERYAVGSYLKDQEVKDLVAKFGTAPDVITWGDYFQAEIGGQYFDASDEEFSRIVDTIRFDFISSVMIFSNKPDVFMEKVRREGQEAQMVEPTRWTDEQREAAHLFILYNYFQDMNFEADKIAEEDKVWYQGFIAEAGTVAG